MSAPVEYATDGPSLRLVLGSAAILSLVFGVLSYWRYAGSEAWVLEGREHMDRVGAQLDDEGCIDAALEWAEGCEAHGTNKAVCTQAVKIQMFHCLAAGEREEACEDYTQMPDKGQWVYARCEQKGLRCLSKKDCACAYAYRALESFCRTGGEAVQM